MVAWILCENNGGALKPVGVFGSEQAGRDGAIDGHYLLIPIDTGQIYDNMISISAPGAVLFEKSGEKTRLTALEDQAVIILAGIDQISARLDTMQANFQTANAALQDLTARVEALEAG